MNDFHRTGMGQTFFNKTMPEIAGNLERIAAALEELAPEPEQVNVLTPDEVAFILRKIEESGCVTDADEEFRAMIRRKLL